MNLQQLEYLAPPSTKGIDCSVSLLQGRAMAETFDSCQFLELNWPYKNNF